MKGWERSVLATETEGDAVERFWSGRRVLVTGHTGFKGSWLSLWLVSEGAEVFGYSRRPETEFSLYEASKLGEDLDDRDGDVKDLPRLREAMRTARPEIVFHLAAQPLVGASYEDPVGTFETNVMGTVNVLEAIRGCMSARAVIVVTTDKVYENREWLWSYRENERLGGKDPYSASKACAELAVRAYVESFFSDESSPAIATARAGNIFGGGDGTRGRLVPDGLAALADGRPIELRNPQAVRPWQHVLAPLQGYMRLAERLYSEGKAYQEAWNFGPNDGDVRTVHQVAERLAGLWGSSFAPRPQTESTFKEARALRLDSSKARALLGWTPRWSLETALRKTVEWQKAYLGGSDARELCLRQIREYEEGDIG